MKHIHIVSKHVPLKAYWWNWIWPVKAIGKPDYLAFLDQVGAVDPRRVGQVPGEDW